MPDPHTYTNDEGDVLLPWDSVRDMLERLVGQELFSKPLALADLLYHWQRGKPITARDAATRWKWSKTRAAEFIAENRGQVPDKFRTNSGQETGEIAGNHGNRGQVPDKLRTNPGQQRKFPPTPPIKETTPARDKRAGVDDMKTNPQLQPPTREQVQQWAETTSEPAVPPVVAWEIAESYESKGWVDRNEVRITNWQKGIASAYRWRLKGGEKNAANKKPHPVGERAASTDYSRRRDFGNQQFEEPSADVALPDVQPRRRR